MVHKVQISRASADYPRDLNQYLAVDDPEQVICLGNSELLRAKTLALFCSVKAPGSIILQAHDLAQNLKREKIPVISGFHSPVEREVLRVLLRGQSSILICPARSIEKMRVRTEFKAALNEGRLAFVSPFTEHQHRATQDLAWQRNRFVAALAKSVLVAYAYPGGKTEQLCREVIAWHKPLYTLDNAANTNLVALGAQIICADDLLQEMGHWIG